ncbi:MULTISPECIES: hypothetical protein [Streptomyces]|uniref:Serine/threonine protein kinase n=1 Tax=Streptomyces ramulosus TaxID=47762 RepID=A0ABW1FNC2_9ACTN
MTAQPPPDSSATPKGHPDRPPTPTTSFTATPTDQARTYQTGRDQTIHEQHHHHYAPTPPPASDRPKRPMTVGVTWSLVTAAVLALGAVAGVVLWERHKASTTDPAAATGPTGTTAPATPPATPQPSPSPDAASSAPPTPTAKPTQRPAAPAASTVPDHSGPVPNPAADRCRPWTTTSQAPGVQVRSCARLDGGRLYLAGEWRTASGHALVDVYLWLEDATGNEVIYPGPDKPNGEGFHSMPAYPEPRDDAPQWREVEVRHDLVPGKKYQVCIYVTTAGSPRPNIGSPKTTGLQYAVTYR